MNYREVAASLGLSPAGVGVAISEGRIKSTRVDGRRSVSPEEVERYRREQLGRKASAKGQDPMPRFWSKVDRSGDCWTWRAGLSAAGYGRFKDADDGRTWLAHRWYWVRVNGPVPEGLQLDHLCRVRSCVNPAHLEPVTPGENVRRGEGGRVIADINRAKTHCPSGHPYAGSNLIRRGGRRLCRTCQNAAHRRHQSYRREMTAKMDDGTLSPTMAKNAI